MWKPIGYLWPPPPKKFKLSYQNLENSLLLKLILSGFWEVDANVQFWLKHSPGSKSNRYMANKYIGVHYLHKCSISMSYMFYIHPIFIPDIFVFRDESCPIISRHIHCCLLRGGRYAIFELFNSSRGISLKCGMGNLRINLIIRCCDLSLGLLFSCSW